MSTATEYRSLLAQYAPQPIRSDRAYHRAVAQLEKLMSAHPDAARSLLIDVLSTLIEKYESRVYPTPEVGPGAMFAHLLESKGVRSVEVAKATGISPATLSSVLASRRGISKENAFKLGKFFGVSPMVFLAATESDRRAAKPKRAALG
jgi:HTH-type transcriptional regulator / antitoxin HigA